MNKSIVPLAIVASAAVLASALFLPEQKSSETATEYAFVELRGKAAQVDRISIENADGTLLAAKKQGSDWLSSQFEGFPVATQSLSELLQSLVQAKNVEPKTAREDRYAKLGVEPVTDANATSVLVKLYAGDTLVTSVLVGNSASNGNAYIRKPSAKQSWLINTEISLPFSNTEWLAQPALGVSVENVMSLVKLSGEPGGQTEWEISRSSADDEPASTQSDFAFAPMPERATLKYPTVLQNAVNTLLTMEFEGLKPFSEPAPTAVTVSYRLALDSGEVLTMQVAEGENEKWLQFTDYKTPQMDGGESKAPLLKEPLSKELLSKTALILQQSRAFKWQYRLSDFNAEQWHKTPEDFFDLPEETTSETN